MTKFLAKFRRDGPPPPPPPKDGAVTVDWVVLTAAIVGLGIAVISTVAGGASEIGSNILRPPVVADDGHLLIATRDRRMAGPHPPMRPFAVPGPRFMTPRKTRIASTSPHCRHILADTVSIGSRRTKSGASL